MKLVSSSNWRLSIGGFTALLLVTSLLTACGGGSANNTAGNSSASGDAAGNVVAENNAPTADAGTNRTANKKTSVTLDGSASFDPDGEIVSYAWKQTAGTEVEWIDAAAANAVFTMPDVLADETLTFELTVTDNSGGKAYSSVNVLVRNRLTGYFIAPPVAGLHYQTPTLSGETGTKGEFEYNDNEQVTFTIGDISLGTALAAPQVTPFDLVGITPPMAAAEVDKAIQDFWNTKKPTPLGVVANIAQFLQTVDEDANPDNGIAIPPALHDVATGQALDFSKIPVRPGYSGYWLEWDNRYSPLYRFIGLARLAGLWGGVRVVRDPLYALDSLYAGLGLVPDISVFSKKPGDRSYYNASWTCDYNANGRQTQCYYEYPPSVTRGLIFNGRADGPPWEWDANGGATKYNRFTMFDDGKGKGGSKRKYSYSGYTAMYSYYYPYYSRTWAMDPMANKITESVWKEDGSLSSYAVHSFDRQGNKVLEEYDSDGDGNIDSRNAYAYTYDEQGNKVLEEFDKDADGNADSRNAYAYDGQGNKVLEEFDKDADGNADSRNAYAYDGQGNKVLEEFDKDADGNADSRNAYAYDGQGNKVLEEFDNDADGNADSRYTYAYDGQGNQVLKEYDSSDADSNADSRYIYAYDGQGHKVLEEYDSDADGNVDSRYIYTYNVDGILVLREYDSNADGIIDHRYENENLSTDIYIKTGKWANYLDWEWWPYIDDIGKKLTGMNAS
ncbi:hypothetical protein Thini_0408 [Thiothrix nivea DSM 5205]|uniref:PKD/Chitinase domain-containing protein n=2 Tax=Thiothrix nivea TaxID=1031 RepID=A0A656H8S2_THINJ|nr:hypothetical protein Thini_0408 [Thiothrix nivea DSM 5205]